MGIKDGAAVEVKGKMQEWERRKKKELSLISTVKEGERRRNDEDNKAKGEELKYLKGTLELELKTMGGLEGIKDKQHGG